ncbi:ABC transporter substrate-binding protein [Clostridia bacterium]|nr:ABC transporter substrate-binding protein [Clostridia bacterium]
MKMKLRNLMSLCLALMLVLSGLGAVQAESAPFEITVYNGPEPSSLDPSTLHANDLIDLIAHMFEGITKISPNGGTELAQAASYTVSEDQLTWTFTLRDDIFWSDGVPVKAQDFVYSWRRLVSGPYDFNYFLDMLENAVAIQDGQDPATLGVEAPDDKTLVLKLIAPCPYLFDVLAFADLVPLRKDIITQYGDEWCLDPATYISNGAYTLKEWINQDHLTMVANDLYYDRANLGPDIINWLLLDNDTTALASFESGELIYAANFPTDETARLASMGVLNIDSLAGTYYVLLNQHPEKGPEVLKDLRVRQALSLAIDREYLVESVTKTGEVAADAWIPEGFLEADGSDYHDHTVKWWDNSAYDANVAKAQELLAEAGYANGAGFPQLSFMLNPSARNQSIAEYCSAAWKEALNIDVSIESQEWQVFLDSRDAAEYNMARSGWTVDYLDVNSLMELWLTGGGNNDAHYSNPEYDALISAAQKEADPVKRLSLYHQAEAILAADLPIIPLYFYTDSYVFDRSAYDGFYSYLAMPYFKYLTAK